MRRCAQHLRQLLARHWFTNFLGKLFERLDCNHVSVPRLLTAAEERKCLDDIGLALFFALRGRKCYVSQTCKCEPVTEVMPDRTIFAVMMVKNSLKSMRPDPVLSISEGCQRQTEKEGVRCSVLSESKTAEARHLPPVS